MIAVISVTERGNPIGDKIANNLKVDTYYKTNIKDFSLNRITKKAFKEYEGVVFISSTGIAVRAISKYLIKKNSDPAVVVVDVCNKFTISLLSGHLGGANKLTIEISKILKNTPVITTATDNLNIIAPDMLALENNLIIDDLKVAKDIASKLVNNEVVYFKDDEMSIPCPSGYSNVNEVKGNTVWVTNEGKNYSNVLKLIRKNIVLGIGCRRNTPSNKMYSFVIDSLKERNIDIKAVKEIASIDIKRDEEALLDLKRRLGSGLSFFSAEEIEKVEEKYEGSEFVKKTVGVKAVSEPVVELLGGEILYHKIKKDGMTLTIGKV